MFEKDHILSGIWDMGVVYNEQVRYLFVDTKINQQQVRLITYLRPYITVCITYFTCIVIGQ